MSAKHTPGPWVIERKYGNKYTRIASACGAFITGGLCGLDDEVEANARLIAAAPDLLQMLKAFDCYYVGSGETCAICSQWPHRRDCALVALISKVEGVQDEWLNRLDGRKA